jgi:hypothetical protein
MLIPEVSYFESFYNLLPINLILILGSYLIFAKLLMK